MLCGTTILGLAVGVIALVFAARHHDTSDTYCLGIVIGLAVLAIFAAFYSYTANSPLYHVNDSIWSQVGGYDFLTLFVLPPLTALMYGLARARLVQALTAVGLIAALTNVIAILQ